MQKHNMSSGSPDQSASYKARHVSYCCHQYSHSVHGAIFPASKFRVAPFPSRIVPNFLVEMFQEALVSGATGHHAFLLYLKS
eukprot:scaffold540067_cov31-Prasinocladus_malaysianus.AAC.1